MTAHDHKKVLHDRHGNPVDMNGGPFLRGQIDTADKFVSGKITEAIALLQAAKTNEAIAALSAAQNMYEIARPRWIKKLRDIGEWSVIE